MTDLAGLLGLGYRSRNLFVGVDRVRRALQLDEVHCIVIAEDASERAYDKVVRLARGKEPVCFFLHNISQADTCDTY